MTQPNYAWSVPDCGPDLAFAKATPRPRVGGKFLFCGDEKFHVRGVTYGTFRPDQNGCEYHPDLVERDFAQMAAVGINAVRTYTVPPRWLLDAAGNHGIRVLVGLPWEEHVDFLADRSRMRDIVSRVRAGVSACAGHSAVLGYAIGNEIPAPIVRWCGPRRVERFLKHLYWAVKEEDPEGLVTYVNYPSTEYLDLPFIDFVSFNVYLESPESFCAYLARLQTIAGDRPLLMAENGLDSRRNGEEGQARALDWQIRYAFAAGCAGTFVFAWTDEWHRGGYDVEDWDFGLTDRGRRAKPALAAVSEAFADAPFPTDLPWPRISVVVCSHNGQRTIGDCLAGLRELRYPDFEVIVVDDGSTDATAAIAESFDEFQLIRTENRGLSSARNTGLGAATGEIVAYLDDDARPDPDWLSYLALTFLTTDHAGVGGPNIPVPDDGWIADGVANAPGGPIHVLLSDSVAEHIPGCNMAFRKASLEAIGGFDPQFRVAGDDVDICWRLQQRGWTLGFSPSAMVWHHRRNSLRTYWKQQQGYAKAEALLQRKWPEKYNLVGHPRWIGRVYNKGLAQALGIRRARIYQGTWGSAPFQSNHYPEPRLWEVLPVMPEWYLVIAGLAILSVLGLSWHPLLAISGLLPLAIGALLVQAGQGAMRATFPSASGSRRVRFLLLALTTFLHLLQPLARLTGRLRYGLTVRRRTTSAFALPWPRTITIWSERWRAPVDHLHDLETALRQTGVCAQRGGEYDRWDLEIPGGLFGSLRLRSAVEEHGSGRQLARWQIWPRCSVWWLLLATLFIGLGVDAARDQAWIVAVALGLSGCFLLLRIGVDCAVATATATACLTDVDPGVEVPRRPADWSELQIEESEN